MSDRIDNSTFGAAIELMQDGWSVTRKGWYGRYGRHFIRLHHPHEQSDMTESYIYITTQRGERIPWLASQADMLASDWMRVV